MNFFENIVHFLDGSMETPKPYGIFHIVACVLVILLTAFLVVKMKNVSDKTFRTIVFIFWITVVLLEVYKQINYSFNYNDGDPYWDYQWYAFPFQFCSTPIFVLPLIIFLPDGKVRNAAIAFMCYFSFVAGVSVMLLPSDVFISTIGINIQTMVHHGMQVVLGVYIAVHRRKTINLKFLLGAVSVLSVLIVIALILDVAVYNILVANGIDETFNMFFISPYFPCTLPVLSSIYTATPYPVFLFLYILAMSLGGGIVFFAQKGIILLNEKIRLKKSAAAD